MVGQDGCARSMLPDWMYSSVALALAPGAFSWGQTWSGCRISVSLYIGCLAWGWSPVVTTSNLALSKYCFWFGKTLPFRTVANTVKALWAVFFGANQTRILKYRPYSLGISFWRNKGTYEFFEISKYWCGNHCLFVGFSVSPSQSSYILLLRYQVFVLPQYCTSIA